MNILVIRLSFNINSGATDDVAWSLWSEYSNCTLACGGSKKVRKRTCVWGICSGPSNETKDCGMRSLS